MVIKIIDHARERMEKYGVSEESVKAALERPDNIIKVSLEGK